MCDVRNGTDLLLCEHVTALQGCPPSGYDGGTRAENNTQHPSRATFNNHQLNHIYCYKNMCLESTVEAAQLVCPPSVIYTTIYLLGEYSRVCSVCLSSYCHIYYNTSAWRVQQSLSCLSVLLLYYIYILQHICLESTVELALLVCPPIVLYLYTTTHMLGEYSRACPACLSSYCHIYYNISAWRVQQSLSCLCVLSLSYILHHICLERTRACPAWLLVAEFHTWIIDSANPVVGEIAQTFGGRDDPKPPPVGHGLCASWGYTYLYVLTLRKTFSSQ